MSRNQEIKMEKGDLTISVMPSSVTAYQSNGWTRVEDGSSDDAAELTEFRPLVADDRSQSADPNMDKE